MLQRVKIVIHNLVLTMQLTLYQALFNPRSSIWLSLSCYGSKLKRKAIFILRFWLYEFNVLSIGLFNAPTNFKRLMGKVLNGLDWKICRICIDDIIILSSTFKEHHLGHVFSRLREANRNATLLATLLTSCLWWSGF